MYLHIHSITTTTHPNYPPSTHSHSLRCKRSSSQRILMCVCICMCVCTCVNVCDRRTRGPNSWRVNQFHLISIRHRWFVFGPNDHPPWVWMCLWYTYVSMNTHVFILQPVTTTNGHDWIDSRLGFSLLLFCLNFASVSFFYFCNALDRCSTELTVRVLSQ